MKPTISTTLHLKANSRGSWTNVCTIPTDNLVAVKKAVLLLCLEAGASVSFKITDDHNVTLHSLDARQQPIAWQDRLN